MERIGLAIVSMGTLLLVSYLGVAGNSEPVGAGGSPAGLSAEPTGAARARTTTPPGCTAQTSAVVP